MTRRFFAASLATSNLAYTQISPVRRYIDPSTEVEVFAVSDTAKASYLSFPGNRFASARNSFFVYATETSGGLQAVRQELKGGFQKPLTTAQALEPLSVCLSADDRTLFYADGDRLLATPIAANRPRELYRAESTAAFRRGISLSDDGQSIVLFDGGKLVLIPTGSTKPVPRTLCEATASLHHPLVHKSGHVLYRNDTQGLFLVPTSGEAAPRRLAIEGDIGPAAWNPDGRSFLFLRVNQGPGIANSLHEYNLETNKESLVGKTSQFVQFGRNGDSSVFVGASGSKAQPFILLMLRITRRELALCEHKASDPGLINPSFSPSSQRIFFQSDRFGKPAIFSVVVDRLVEKTESDEQPAKKT